MVNFGFRGKREAYLFGFKAALVAADKEGKAEDLIKSILRGYFKRFPLDDFPNEEEPCDDCYGAVDDEALEEEPAAPREEDYAPAEYENTLRKHKERSEQEKKLIAVRACSYSPSPHVC